MNPLPSAERPSVEILIVEDSPTQALLLRRILEKHGFGVSAASNGRTALETLQSRRPSLIVSDIQMPEIDGYELCRRLKADVNWKEVPVMLLTALSEPEDIIQGLECGADNFVVKPYEEKFLISRIESVLTNCALKQTPSALGGIAVDFAGRRYVIDASRRQILNLLLSTYEAAIKTNHQLIRAHDELRAAQAQLIEAEKLQSVGRLAAGVAHEVRNPLAIIELGLGFLGGQAETEACRAVLDEMQQAVRHANEVIAGLMNLSSPRELGMLETDLHAIVEHALEPVADALAQARISVVREFAADLPCAQFDAAKMEQVLVNVFTNALHAMPGGGTLAIRTNVTTIGSADVVFEAGGRSGVRFREGEPVITLEIEDTGEGIAPENLNKVYDPFFSTKPTGKGMGLGLTVARKLVELHRGAMRIQNRSGAGVAVTMTFKTV